MPALARVPLHQNPATRPNQQAKAKEQSAREQSPERLPIRFVEQEQHPTEHWQYYKMCRVTSEAEHGGTHRKNRITCRRRDACCRIYQSSPKEKDQHDCG